MSETTDRGTVGGGQSRGRARKIRRSPSGTLGIPEITGLSIAAIMLLSAIVGYFYFLAPAKSRAATLAREPDHLREQLKRANEAFRSGVATKQRVADITVSLEKFEEDRLADRDGGRMALYADVNQLMHKNGLRNTSGPAYTSLEQLGVKTPGQATAVAPNSANKWQSIYPGIGVNVTVEGQYQNIRHFVRDIESSKEFIIINAIELERATENSQPAMDVGAPKSGSGNALVSLRLDMATYFSRPVQANEKPAVNAN